MSHHIRRSLWNYLERHPTAERIVALCQRRRVGLVIFVWLFAHILGALTSIRAIMEVRTPQGTIAWDLAATGFNDNLSNARALNTLTNSNTHYHLEMSSAPGASAYAEVAVELLVPVSVQ